MSATLGLLVLELQFEHTLQYRPAGAEVDYSNLRTCRRVQGRSLLATLPAKMWSTSMPDGSSTRRLANLRLQPVGSCSAGFSSGDPTSRSLSLASPPDLPISLLSIRPQWLL